MPELDRIAQRYASRRPFLGIDLDEALISAKEHYCSDPTSTDAPEGVFRVCLRREQSRRLKCCDDVDHF